MFSNLIRPVIEALPFGLIMSFTPGPNNIMIASSAARFGFMRSLPLQAGIVVGFAILTAAAGLGTARLAAANPTLVAGMKWLSLAYLLWLAWQLATAEFLSGEVSARRPVSFLKGAVLQWVNPKAWVMAVTVVTAYTSPASGMTRQVVVLIAMFAVIGVASTSVWALFGQALRGVLRTRTRLRAFNLAMAAALVASLVPVAMGVR